MQQVRQKGAKRKSGNSNIVTLFHCKPSGNDSKNAIKSHRDLNSDNWIQSPECQPLHHGAFLKHL